MSRTFNEVRPALFQALCEMTNVRWKPEEPFFKHQYRVHCTPYLVQVITDDVNLSIKIYDERADQIKPAVFYPKPALRDSLLETRPIAFPTNIRHLKQNWDAKQHLLDERFRLILVMTRLFSILLPEDEI